MCNLCSRAAKLIHAPWLGNKKDENAVSCAHNLRLVPTKPCRSPATKTNMQAPTTAACIMEENYGTTTCSKANVHNRNPALHYSADRRSTRPPTSRRSFQRQRVSVVRVQVLRTGDPHNRYWCLVPVSASPARKRTNT